LPLAALTLCAARSLAQQPTPDLAALVASQQAHPNDSAAKRALENAVCSGLPEQLAPSILLSLPVAVSDAPDGLGELVVPKPYLPVHATEPQQGLDFAHVTYLYASSLDGTQHLFCSVHYTLPDDAPLAARMARLLALAHRTLLTQSGRPPAGGEVPFDVWLCRNGRAGGEQWGRNLYFYDLDAPRSSIEWIREIVHEYSHLALPAIGGYKDPEYWANGYLGERLIVRWFQRMPDGDGLVTRAWGDFSGAENFDKLLIAPDMAIYKRVGPNPAWVARTDAQGMGYLIGQALTADDKYGPKVVGTALAALPRVREATAADWEAALAEAIKAAVPVARP
jgi:hypothetical protein